MRKSPSSARYVMNMDIFPRDMPKGGIKMRKMKNMENECGIQEGQKGPNEETHQRTWKGKIDKKQVPSLGKPTIGSRRRRKEQVKPQQELENA